jgi:hypothetical protein
VFTVEDRDRIRRRLLELAEADPGIAAAALTGSYATGGGDEWSDVDVALAVEGDVPAAVERWTELIYREFAAIHHWELRAHAVYRVFLLANSLELDIGFTPAPEFGPHGPNWRLVFGEAVEQRQFPPVDRDALIGLAWHHVLHARACIRRGKPWQAEWLIAGAREHVLALACLRLGYETRFARGADRLPPELTDPFEATLVRSLEVAELQRALAAVSAAFAAELRWTDAQLAERLGPMLLEVSGA